MEKYKKIMLEYVKVNYEKIHVFLINSENKRKKVKAIWNRGKYATVLIEELRKIEPTLEKNVGGGYHGIVWIMNREELENLKERAIKRVKKDDEMTDVGKKIVIGWINKILNPLIEALENGD